MQKRDDQIIEGDVFTDDQLINYVGMCKEELIELDGKDVKNLIKYFGIHAFISIYQGD
jgi:hypothetical protein